MVKFNFKEKLSIKYMQRKLKEMYGNHFYGYLLAFLLDSTIYFLGNEEEKKIQKITISFNGGKVSTIDLENDNFFHPEFEEGINYEQSN